MTDFLGMNFLPATGVLPGLGLLLGINLVFTAIAVSIYFRLYRHSGYVFTYVILNVVTFSIGFLLSKVPIELGFALGLFGVFGILRYRTEAIPVRELTYLFAVIGLALLNALAHQKISLSELLIVNVVIVGAIGLLEVAAFSVREGTRNVLYDRLDLLGPDTADALLEDLRRRTHLPVMRYEIGDVDLLKDTAAVTVYYPFSTQLHTAPVKGDS